MFNLAKGCLPINGKVKHNRRTKKTKFTFSSDPVDDLIVTYRCKLDNRKYRKCELNLITYLENLKSKVYHSTNQFNFGILTLLDF